MALYKTGDIMQRGTNMAQSAQATFGKSSKQGPVTETEPTYMTPRDYIVQGLGMVNTGKQLIGLAKDGYAGTQKLMSWIGAPNASAQAAAAGSGAQAVKDVSSGAIPEAVQMNTGAEVQAGEDLMRQMGESFEETGASIAQNALNQGSGEALSQAGNLVNPGEELLREGATAFGESGAASAGGTGSLSAMGAMAGQAGGGIAGGLAGREIGRAIGGQTGADIGGVVGSLGGAYLGGLGASTLAGATAGSAVPGLGTAIGAGLGALASFFL